MKKNLVSSKKGCIFASKINSKTFHIMRTVKINNTFEAENISMACINPNDVTFDLWNTYSRDFVAEGVNVVEALQEGTIDIPTATAILQAAGMSWIECADCSDPVGHTTESLAKASAAAIPIGLDPIILSAEEYLRSLLGI